MAQVVLGVATPHAPQLRLPIEGWYALREKDETDKRISYSALLANAKPDMDYELSDAVLRERYDTVQANLGLLRDKLAAVNPDVLVVIGDDQHEQFKDANMPMFSVYYGDNIEVVNRHKGGAPAGSGLWSSSRLDDIENAVRERLNVPKDHPAESALARHLINSLRDEEFDIACTNELNPEIGVGHAFVFMYEYMLPNGDIPMVPVMINTFFPPNQPAPRRCYAMGQALRRAIDAWDSNKTVALVASGGLSHTIMDEGIDHMTIDGVMEKDAEALRTLPRERLNLGTSEIRNWIAIAGAMEAETPHMIGDYIPAYRSPAGTGCGIAFTYWE